MVQMCEGTWYHDARGLVRGPALRRCSPHGELSGFPWVIRDEHGADVFTEDGESEYDFLKLLNTAPAPTAEGVAAETPAPPTWLGYEPEACAQTVQATWLGDAPETLSASKLGVELKPAEGVVADKQVWVKLDEDQLQQKIQTGTDLWSGQVGGDHYTKHRIQPLEFMMANRLDGTESLVLKYICRWRDKGGIQDLQKARDVLDKMIDYAERNPEFTKA
ncbi:DUF3310 domain-containing protein [Pannonibacter tanglangensis]|uniref:DUF3310 domain-containing protein n=1 Tax=Pannonibacter tanglangensis TaxID=2750084 RepID=A0ABW9ZB72_9HYPH|nr:DUF3310 domain-containing protein [Pannonibacter sp. XCT-34]NBN62082.1 DUF3310 domain-containing protein [Pannonibacter sp. XCT-34]